MGVVVDFEWEPDKAQATRPKHSGDGTEAAPGWGDPVTLPLSDREHARGASRFVSLAPSARTRLLVVASPERQERLRLLRARTAAPTARRPSHTDHLLPYASQNGRDRAEIMLEEHSA